MVFADAGIRELWARTAPRVREGAYFMVSYVPTAWQQSLSVLSEVSAADQYCSVIRDGHEIAVIIPASVWARHRSLGLHCNEFGPLACITFDVPLEIEVSGYLAPVVNALAEARISIVPQCALVYDHILVHEKDSERAVSVIQSLREVAGG